MTGDTVPELPDPASERRFVCIIQRGAADGPDILHPTGDPAFVSLRQRLIGATPKTLLDAKSGTHPTLVEVAGMYSDGRSNTPVRTQSTLHRESRCGS